jgi:hypothetical protein
MGMFEGMEGYKDKLTEKTGEPVLAMLFVQPRGATGTGGASYGVSKISPLASMVLTKVKGAKANENAGGLGKMGIWNYQSAVIALTADKIYAYQFKSGWGGMKIKDQIGVWDRKGVTFNAQKQAATVALDIDVASTGEHFEVEAPTMFGAGKYVDEFLAEVATTG